MTDEEKLQAEKRARNKERLLDQVEVNYTPVSMQAGKACAGCRWFEPAESWREGEDRIPSCHLVNSWPQSIQPTGYCDRYEVIPAAEPPTQTPIPVVIIDPETLDTKDDSPPEEPDEAEVDDATDDEAAPMNPAEKSVFDRVWARIQERLGSKEASDGTGFKVAGNHWLAIWSNDFKDREGEIFTRKAIDEYVRRTETGLVPLPELWDSHIPGTRSGQAEFVARHGHFLIALGRFDDTPKGQAAKAFYQKHAHQQGISHGYRFPSSQFDGKHYHAFNTFEISPLQRGAEANRFTSLEGIKAMVISDKQRERINKVFKDQADQILADLDEGGKALEELGVEFKEFAEVPEKTDEKGVENALLTDIKELFPELIGADADNARANLLLAKKVKEQGAAITKLEAYVAARKAERPKRSSEADETELDESDADDKAIIDEINKENADAKAVKAFPGLYGDQPSIYGKSTRKEQ